MRNCTTTYELKYSAWKSLKSRIWDFQVWHFPSIFSPVKIDLFLKTCQNGQFCTIFLEAELASLAMLNETFLDGISKHCLLLEAFRFD